MDFINHLLAQSKEPAFLKEGEFFMNTHMNRLWWMATIAFLLITASSVLPVAATVQFPDFRHFYIEPANPEDMRVNPSGNYTYYFKLDGGGTNALHITYDPINVISGHLNQSEGPTGTFWLTDTGGRGFDDDAILLIAVNGSAQNLTDFNITITSAGYQWTPTGQVNQIPEFEIVEEGYTNAALNQRIFTSADFFNFTNASIPSPGEQVEQSWKLSTSANYPLLFGENVADTTTNNFKFIFVDLKVGILGTGTNSTYYTNLNDYGAAKVTYSINSDLHPDTFVAFNAYAWCNQSNQQQGVSWTNAMTGTGASGWLVKPS